MAYSRKKVPEPIAALRLPALLDELDAAIDGHDHHRAITAAIALATAVREVLRGAARDLEEARDA